MKRWLAGMVLAGCAAAPDPAEDIGTEPGATPAPSATAAMAAAAPPPPSLLYPGLFQAVAVTDLYEPKDWVDAVPLADAGAILAAWDAAGRPVDAAALAAFTGRWFAPPEAVGADVALPPGRTLAEHVEALWPVLTRERTGAAEGSLLALPNPYVVPGGRFREVYYWDAYFTMAGMGPRHDAIKRAMVANFAGLIERFGHVPNANRTYYLSRSQPPFFFAMAGLLDPDDPAAAYSRHLPALRAEHAFWKGAGAARAVTTEAGTLARYYDDRDAPRDESYRYDVATAAGADRPARVVYRELRAGAESGWDYSSRWFAGDGLSSVSVTDVAPVDLNSILYGLEEAVAAGCERAGDAACAEGYAVRAGRTRAAMAPHWDEGLGAFVDARVGADGALRPAAWLTAATVYPLFFGVATDEQAARVAETVRADLLAPGGLLTTTVHSDEQWDAPNGWAPLQWLAVLGFERYGHDDLAHEIARRWTATVARGFCESGKLVEKYDVVTAREGGGGEYPTQDGFGWTNGVTMALIGRDARLARLADIPEMTDAPEACADAVEAALRGGLAAADAGPR